MEPGTRSHIQSDFTAAFQTRYCLTMAAGSMATSLLFYFYLDRSMGEGYLQSLLTLSNLEKALPFSLLATFLFQLLLITALSAAISLFVSHKIAGPVYRYELTLKKILKGDLRGEVRTRQGDQLKPLVDSFNHLLGSLQRVFHGVHDLDRTLGKEIHRLAFGKEADTEALLRQVAEVRWRMGIYSPAKLPTATDVDPLGPGAAGGEEPASRLLDVDPGDQS